MREEQDIGSKAGELLRGEILSLSSSDYEGKVKSWLEKADLQHKTCGYVRSCYNHSHASARRGHDVTSGHNDEWILNLLVKDGVFRRHAARLMLDTILNHDASFVWEPKSSPKRKKQPNRPSQNADKSRSDQSNTKRQKKRQKNPRIYEKDAYRKTLDAIRKAGKEAGLPLPRLEHEMKNMKLQGLRSLAIISAEYLEYHNKVEAQYLKLVWSGDCTQVFIESPTFARAAAEKLVTGQFGGRLPHESIIPSRTTVQKKTEASSSENVPSGSVPAIPIRSVRPAAHVITMPKGGRCVEGDKLRPIVLRAAFVPSNGRNPYLKAIDAWACEKCGRAYADSKAIRHARSGGVLHCEVSDPPEKDQTFSSWIDKLNRESIAHRYGYNVGKQDDLSENERRDILSFLMENGIQNRDELANLLSALISIHERQPQMYDAIGLWEDDLRYVERYRYARGNMRIEDLYSST